ncbi:IS66 family transposase zinc-finger binding domain-containing protein [Bradyrhizobium genosp. A]|uniref:IS66 family transposase zinc-finger binding domain-containing protein n=1 Tax=Bradyrhizobium genosp. A TaxID=83626 RepID=UPI003CE67C53
MVPAQFRVAVTRRPKYACRACEDGVPAGRGAASCGSSEAGRWLMPSRYGCAPSWLSSARRSSSPKPSATPLALARLNALHR